MFTPDDNLEILKGGLEGLPPPVPGGFVPGKDKPDEGCLDWGKVEARVLGRKVEDGDIPVIIDKFGMPDRFGVTSKCNGYRGPLPDFKPHPGAQADFMQMDTKDHHKAWINGHWVTPSRWHRLWCWVRMHKTYVAGYTYVPGYTWGDEHSPIRNVKKPIMRKIKSCLNCNYGGKSEKGKDTKAGL